MFKKLKLRKEGKKSSKAYLSLAGSPSHLPRMPSNTVLVSGPAVGEAQILIWSYSCVFLPPGSTAIRASVFSFVGVLSSFYIFHRHRVCLVDHADLIRSLYSWWEGLGPCSLPTLPLGFNCSFISTFYFFMWVVHWGLLLRLPWRTWVYP